LLRCRLLGVGFIETDWGNVGCDRDAPREILDAGWNLALESLDSFAAGINADIISFVDINEIGGESLPMSKLQRYASVAGRPCGMVPINFQSIDEYLDTLSKVTRKNLRRKAREASDVTTVETTDAAPWIDEMYRMYLDTIERSEAVFGEHSQQFFL